MCYTRQIYKLNSDLYRHTNIRLWMPANLFIYGIFHSIDDFDACCSRNECDKEIDVATQLRDARPIG